MKLSSKKIRKLIREAIESAIKVPNLTKRSLPHDMQQEPIPPEWFAKKQPGQYPFVDQEVLDKIEGLRSPEQSDPRESGKQADTLATSLGLPSMTHKGYTDVKSAYDKAHPGSPYDDHGRYKQGHIEGIDSLDSDESNDFQELGYYLEYDEHPEHGSMHDTVLYQLYDSIAKGEHGNDIVRAIKMLEDYLSNPDYEEDRVQIEAITLQMAKKALKDMKRSKKWHFYHYNKDFGK